VCELPQDAHPKEAAINILIYGSAYMTALAEQSLMLAGHTVMGHVPCANPSFRGKMLSPVVPAEYVHTVPYDIALSVFYDRRVERLDAAYNIHPGLLPRWGGCDILYHTVRLGARQQGLTLHKMVRQFDRGPIISRITYPVFEGDRPLDLYKRICDILPGFVVSSMPLLLGIPDFPPAPSHVRYFRRGLIDDRDLFFQYGQEIKKWVEAQP
jgi:methionyl-tRNA formyltransferase